MEWLGKIKDFFPLKAGYNLSKQSITFLFKVNVTELEVCKPKAFTRERSLGRTEKLDIIHALPNGKIRHNPIN